MVLFRDNPCLPLRILRYFPRIHPPSILDTLLHIQISDRYTPHNHVHVHQHRASFTSNSHTTATTNTSLHCTRASISQIAFIYTHSAHSFICHRLTDISRHLFDRHTTYNNGIFSHLRYLPPPHLPLYHAIPSHVGSEALLLCRSNNEIPASSKATFSVSVAGLVR